MQRYLRPEARPVDWRQLDAEQRKVFRQVVKMITEAIETLPDPNQRRESRRDVVGWLSQDRTSRGVFLSGARGTGKTTVLVSLIKASTEKTTTAVRETFPEDVRYGVNLMRERAIWLEYIDMEPMPHSANLLAAILARVEDAMRWLEMRGSNGLVASSREYERRRERDIRPDYRDALLELQRLQTNIALAWDGNLAARAGALDPDAYAIEVMRTERARLTLHENLSEVLDRLARHASEDPLFILPIDDFDLNPPACLELLRLLRMIAVPRLFILVLGDMNVAEVVLNLKLSSALAQVAEGAAGKDLLSIHPAEITAMAGEVAAHSLRKLIPPAQRLMLLPMTLHEAINFRPLGYDSKAPQLFQLLAQCPAPFESSMPSNEGTGELPSFSEREINNLCRFLLVTVPSLVRAQSSSPPLDDVVIGMGVTQQYLTRTVYSALGMLQATPRRLTDLWFALQQVGEDASDRQRHEVVRVVSDHCRSLLFEEIARPYDARHLVSQAFSRTPMGLEDLGRLPVSLTATTGPGATIPVLDHPYNTRTIRLQFQVQRAIDWRFIWEDRERRELSGETTGALILLHDLLALTPEVRGVHSPWLSADQHFGALAVTEWRSQRQKIEFPWPAIPPCTSFWEFDVFRQTWNEAIDLVRTRGLLNKEALHTLAFAWIAAGTAVVERRDPEPLTSELAGTGDWQRLYQHLESLVPPPEASTQQDIRARNWLTSLAVFLMPESGLLDGSPVNAFTGANRLRAFWGQQGRLISRRRGLRLAQLIRKDMASLSEDTVRRRTSANYPRLGDLASLAEDLRQQLPPGLSSRLRPGKDYVMRLVQGLEPFDDEEFEVESNDPTATQTLSPPPANAQYRVSTPDVALNDPTATQRKD